MDTIGLYVPERSNNGMNIFVVFIIVVIPEDAMTHGFVLGDVLPANYFDPTNGGGSWLENESTSGSPGVVSHTGNNILAIPWNRWTSGHLLDTEGILVLVDNAAPSEREEIGHLERI